MEALRLYKRPDGVAVLVFDTPDSSVNILSRAFFDEFKSCLDEVERDGSVKAAVLSSGKADNFIGGANLKEFLAMKEDREGESFSRDGHALLNRMARSAKPFVAAIHGPALGGGLEVALACRYRIATDHPKTVVGQPEVMLGLLPGGGGCQRLPRLVGLPLGLEMVLTGKRLRARQALRAGVVDALTSPGGLVDTAAKAALLVAEGKLAPVDKRTAFTKLLGSALVRPFVFREARKGILRKTLGLYAAPLHTLACVREGLSKGVAAGEEMESVLFGQLTASPRSKNLIRLFEAMTDLKKVEKGRPVAKLAVLGAGLMGEGIASVSLPLNPVVLKDLTDASLAKAARNLGRSLERRVRSGSLRRVERDQQWFGLRLTTEVKDLAGADLVIEAVFEELALKRRVLAETEAVIAADAVFASNTSALPISRIAEGARHPERVLGMHYFSPVPKMPLLEIVVTEKTAGWALDTARSYGIAQGKTVIVVKDGPGFYTTRILAPFLNEAILLLDEGVEIEALDRALKGFGFPVGPIALLDEVGIDVGAHVAQDLGAAFLERGLGASPSLPKLLAAGYAGRKNGKGFYVYPAPGAKKGKKRVNQDVYAFFGGGARKGLSADEMADRLSLLMVNEAIHCLADGVIAAPRDGDAGAVLGLGFPPFLGGPFRYVDERGAADVVNRMSGLAKRLGPRFVPAPLLVEMATTNGRFHPA